jgi:CspA family cold shock protein
MCDKNTDTTNTTSSDRLIGQVKWFNTKAGYGFVTVCTGEHAGKDIFVHYSSILVENSQYKYLVQGEYIEFSLMKSTSDKYEFHAMEVSGINRGTIMCETRKISSELNSPNTRQPVEKIRRYNTSVERSSTRRTNKPYSPEDGFQKVSKKERPVRKGPPATN